MSTQRWVIALMQLALELNLAPVSVGASPLEPSMQIQSPGIGFDLTLGYGTSVVLYPNGTFLEAAHVPGNEAYRLCMGHALENAINARRQYLYTLDWQADIWPKTEPVIGRSWSLRAGLEYIRQIFRDIEKESPQPSLDPTPIKDMLSILKEETERKLDRDISMIGISYPNFFNSSHVNQLSQALQSVSLSDDGCHGDSRSGVAALIAQQHAEPGKGIINNPPDNDQNRLALDSVIHIENTEDALAITAFEFFKHGNITWAQSSFGRPTYLKKWPTFDAASAPLSRAGPKNDSTNSQNQFWVTAQALFEDYLRPTWKSRSDNAYRLILTGSQASDAKLIETLQSTRGIIGTLPPNSPSVLKVYRDEDEILRLQIEAFLHPPSDRSVVFGALWQDYSEFLLALVSQVPQDFNAPISHTFLAAYGAALYDLKSRVTPCGDECSMTCCRERFQRVDMSHFGRDWYPGGWDMPIPDNAWGPDIESLDVFLPSV